jgi:4-hydroxy-3-polyprenylbenzoate decarboxylase
MGGAGQMMFNKILVIADERTKITDYKKLAQDVFRNLNPATDISFSQGPMDVLDHSCSRLGFGGKMCIDGTTKAVEETDEAYEAGVTSQLTAEMLQRQWPEITGVNLSLPAQGIPCLILAVHKERPSHIRELHQAICGHAAAEGIKMILYVEHTVDAADLPVALWRFCNNLDPRRDHFLAERPASTDPRKRFACLGLDGTRKTKDLDDFQRDWPNIIVADEATMAAVDKKWDQLGLGNFIPSPSHKFKNQLYGEEAVVS